MDENAVPLEEYSAPLLYGTGDLNTQYDTFTDHVNRLFSLNGFASPSAGKGVSQRQIIDTMVLGEKSVGGGLEVPDGHFFLAPAEAVRIGINESYTSVPGTDKALGQIFDQDTGNMGWMQEGMLTSRKKAGVLANYQESRIRHMHMTLDEYLA